MTFLKPVDMSRVGVVGLKDDQERILSTLHDLGVLQIETIGKEALQYLQPERASDTQRVVGDQLVRFRGLKSALPPSPSDHRPQFASLAEVLDATRTVTIDDEVGKLKRAEDAALTRRKSLTDTIALLERYSFYAPPLEYLTGARILAFFGEAKPALYDSLRTEVPSLTDAQFFEERVGAKTRFVVAVRSEQAEAIGRLAQQRGVSLTPVPRLQGTISEVLPRLRQELTSTEAESADLHRQLAALAVGWYGPVAAIEEALTIEARKLDVYVKLGTGASTFALEAWVPTRNRVELEHAVDRASGGRAAVYAAPSHEEPPTLMDNPKGIRWFEFFIRFYSIPNATEWDPTWIFAIAFSLFFGFMIADWGFGLVIFLICLWMVLDFPGGKYLPKWGKGVVTTIMGPQGMRQLAFTMLPGALLAIGLGVYVNAVFGAPYDSAAHPPYDLLSNISTLLGISLIFGVAMVVLGFALGALHAYYRHHRREAIGKIGGIVAALGVYGLFSPILAAGAGLAPTGTIWEYVWVGALVGGAALLIVGEGVMMGSIGTLETLTHVLSYARLVGILLASLILASFIVSSGKSLIESTGSAAPLWIVLGAFLLLIGVGFSVILAAFEPSIQGARLLFVEHFSKYYEGNGRSFSPFGTTRTHTVAVRAPADPTR